MKTYLVNFQFCCEEKPFQALVPENLLESYLEKLEKREVFWSEDKTGGVWVNYDRVHRIIIREYIPQTEESKEEEKDAEKEQDKE